MEVNLLVPRNDIVMTEACKFDWPAQIVAWEQVWSLYIQIRWVDSSFADGVEKTKTQDSKGGEEGEAPRISLNTAVTAGSHKAADINNE